MLSAFAKKQNNRPNGRKKQANQPTAEEIHPLCYASPPEGAM